MSKNAAISIVIQDLLDERFNLSSHKLPPPMAAGQWLGSFNSKRRGQGNEFDDLRQYAACDDIRHIDWKTSARTGALQTRLYREERDHHVTVLADLRECMFTGSTLLLAVRACRLAARLIWQAVDGGSRCSVIIISDEGIDLTPRSTGHRCAIAACSLLASRFTQIQDNLPRHYRHPEINDSTHQASATDSTITLPPAHALSEHPDVNLEQMVHWLLQQNIRGSIVWVSAMDHCGYGFDQVMTLLSRYSRQAVIQIDEPMLSNGLPTGRYHCMNSRPGDATSPQKTTGISAAHRSISTVRLGRRECQQLGSALSHSRDRLRKRFDSLSVPLLPSSLQDNELIGILRQGSYLP